MECLHLNRNLEMHFIFDSTCSKAVCNFLFIVQKIIDILHSLRQSVKLPGSLILEKWGLNYKMVATITFHSCLVRCVCTKMSVWDVCHFKNIWFKKESGPIYLHRARKDKEADMVEIITIKLMQPKLIIVKEIATSCSQNQGSRTNRVRLS